MLDTPIISAIDACAYHDLISGSLVPSWVLECIYINNPKETYSLEAELAKDGGADTTERSTDKFRVITINAQTGEVTNPMDTSKNGWGDADYKGFIPWDKVK